MAIDTIRRPTGRESTVVRQRDNFLVEAKVLKSELRDVGNLVPFARYIRDRVAIDCDPAAEQAAGIVLLHLERVRRRHGDGGSAA